MEACCSLVEGLFWKYFLKVKKKFKCFSSKAKEPGTYTLRQLCTSVGKVQFVLLHIYPIVQYDVYSQEPQLKVEPMTGKCNGCAEAALMIPLVLLWDWRKCFMASVLLSLPYSAL